MTERSIVSVLHACTTNDTYGNPRRCYLAIDASGNIAAITDEGYTVPRWVRDMRDMGTYDVTVTVTPRQYAEHRRQGRAMGTWSVSTATLAEVAS